MLLEPEPLGDDPRVGRRLLLFPGDDPSAWTAGPESRLATVLLAIDLGRHGENMITALARRFGIAQIGYLCAWGPGCGRVETLFDVEFVDAQGAGMDRPFLMTTSHDDESLAEALWFAIDCAVSPDAKGVPPVVVGADSPAWRAQLRHWLEDVEALRDAVCAPEE